MIKLDEVDLKILAVLQTEGRITKLKLAERVNLSPTPCWERLRRLEEAGVIAGYSARVDVERIARFTTVLVEITLKSHRYVDFQRFEAAVSAELQVIDCYATGGGVDYILRVATSDIDAYQRLIDRWLMAEIGIDRYVTYVVTKTVKSTPYLPVAALAG